MAASAKMIVEHAQRWTHATEDSTAHREILATYNAIKPLPRGYRMTEKDPWCAAYVSAVFAAANSLDIFPAECSCSLMLEKCRAMGILIEDESITPQLGDVVFYDWGDSGKGDNLGNPDHVGIVTSVISGRVLVIEGNYLNAVRYRSIGINAPLVRAFARPKYASSEPSLIDVANEVIRGEWGVGDERAKRLEAAGYPYAGVQAIVNSILKNGEKSSNEDVAREVIAGKWGVGKERQKRLTDAGYDYKAVQKIVNRILQG